MKATDHPEKESSGGHPVFQLIAAFAATLSIVSSGMHYGWPSPSLPQIQHENSTIPVTNDEGSWIAVMPLLGASVGSMLGVLIVDVVGRKKTILLTFLPFFSAWLMVAYAKSVAVILIARFIAGIGDGLAFCVVPMYLGEIASSSIRGLLGSLSSTTWILGMLLINVIGSHTTIRTAALISSVFPVIMLLTFMWMPESPYYFIMRNQPEDARRSLRIFRKQKSVEKELERITVAVTEDNMDTGRCLDLFTVKSNRKAMLVMLGTRAFQQCTGSMAITFYAQIIFKDAGDDISSSTASTIYFGVQLLCSAIASMIVDKTGRRPLLILSVIGVGIALLTEGTYFYLRNYTPLDVSGYSSVAVGALIVLIVFYGLGLQAIPILLLGELFPTNVKAFALGFADVYFNVIATVVSKFFQIMKDSYGIHVPFFVFAGCCVLSLIFIILCVPETKGKTLEEIQMDLRGKKVDQMPPVEEKHVEIFRSIPVDA